MTERPIRPRARAATTTKSDAEARTDAPARAKLKRYLLPTLRVAEFKIPNVGEFIKLREAVVLKARSLSGNRGDWDEQEAMMAFADVGLPRLLVGLSKKAVPVLYKPTWDPERAQVDALALARLEVAQARVKAAELLRGEKDEAKIAAVVATAKSDDVAESEVEDDHVENAYQRISYEFEDADAMKALANISPVRDADWELDDGSIKRLMEAELGTDEATEWIALGGIVQDFFVQLVQAARGATGLKSPGKAQAATRSWR
jgi:hypothetical protein